MIPNTGIGFANLELGDIDEYSEETIALANMAHSLWESKQMQESRELYRVLAEQRYLYGMAKYGFFLMKEIIRHCIPVMDTPENRNIAYQMMDLFLMGFLRGDDFATACLTKYVSPNNAEQIYKEADALPTIVLYQWLRGEYPHGYPPELQALITTYVNLFFS